MWQVWGVDRLVMVGGALMLAIAAPIMARILVVRRPWERPRRVFWLYTVIFESTAGFGFGWGIATLPRALWLQWAIEIAAIGMLILALTLVARLGAHVSPPTHGQPSVTEERQ